MIKMLFILGHEPCPPDPQRPLYYGICRSVEWPAAPRSGELIVLYTGPATGGVTTARVRTLRWQVDGSVHVLFNGKLTWEQADWMTKNSDWTWTAYSPTDESLPELPVRTSN